MKSFNEFMNIINEDVDVATIKRMTEDQFKELLKRSSASRRNQLNAMRQSNSLRIKPDVRPRVAPTLPKSPPPSAATTTTRPSLLRRVGGGALRLGAFAAADTAAEIGISNIKDPKAQKTARAVKDTAINTAAIYANPILSTAALPSSSAPRGSRQYGDYTISKRIDVTGGESNLDQYLATGINKKGYTYNDPKAEKIYANRTDRIGKDKPFRIGTARRGGQIVPVEWGSVAGERKVGTPQDVAAVKARQKAGQQGAYGSRQGVGIVGTGGKMEVDRQNNTITSGGRTAALPKTKILSNGRVGDLAYRDGKPVYLARASMAQRGNQNLFARLSRATGIGGQRERDAAALAREREQATKNTLKYRKEIGASGGSVSAK